MGNEGLKLAVDLPEIVACGKRICRFDFSIQTFAKAACASPLTFYRDGEGAPLRYGFKAA